VYEATFRLTLLAVVNCTYDYPLSGVKFQSPVKLFFGLPRIELKDRFGWLCLSAIDTELGLVSGGCE
jgi:hypothetical protein